MLIDLPVVNHPNATPLPPAGTSPANFTDTATFRDYIALRRPLNEGKLELGIFILRYQLRDLPRKYRGFNDFHIISKYTSLTYSVKAHLLQDDGGDEYEFQGSVRQIEIGLLRPL